MRMIPSLFVVAGLLAFAGCGGGGNGETDDTTEFNNAWNALRAGQGVADAPSYHGGSIPHKVAGSGSSLLPVEWVAKTVSELQLFIDSDATETKTGRTQEYSYLLTPITYELIHVTKTYTLLEAQTGEVLATKTLQGDGQFPSSITLTSPSGPVMPPSGLQYCRDEVDDSQIIEWLRPFVEQ